MKFVTLDFLETKVCWNKTYDVIVCVYNITSNILLHDSDYIIDVVIWLMFGSSSISKSKVIISTKIFDQKNQF